MKIHKIIFLFLALILVSAAVIQSCGDDNTQNNNGGVTQTTVLGSWNVASAHMVEAPLGSGPSHIMKQQLVPFGLMPAASVGSCTIIFGDSTWSLAGNITNSVIKVICGAYDSVYTANGTYTLTSNTITFIVQDYSGPYGSQNIGSGTFALGSGLTIDLFLPNNEKWKINLNR